MLVLLGNTTTEKVQNDLQDPSLLARDFIIYFYNFISNKVSLIRSNLGSNKIGFVSLTQSIIFFYYLNLNLYLEIN